MRNWKTCGALAWLASVNSLQSISDSLFIDPLDAGYQGVPRNHAGFMSYYVPQLMAALSAPVRARRKEESFDDYVSDLCANSKRLHQVCRMDSSRSDA